MFRHLKTKLTLAYGGVLGLVLAVITLASYLSIQHTARLKIDDDMRATSAVYDHLWQIKGSKLEEGARLISKDFGFREAVATTDIATISSALDNVLSRLDVDAAYIVLADGRGLRAGETVAQPADAEIFTALKSRSQDRGIISIGDIPYQVVSEPVRAPNLVGWVMFGSQLGPAEMGELESLSAIPLKARVVMDQHAGADANRRPAEKDIIVRENSVPGFGTLPDARLVLEYPLAGAMAPFQPMLYAIMIMAGGGIVALLVCSWFISKSVTGPITRLDHAARAFASGHRTQLDVRTKDEIGRLAGSFGRMADEIEAREDNIMRLSLTDTESDLPNRRALQADLTTSPGQGQTLYCAVVSPDRFSKIMAVIGQETSNQLVAALGHRLHALQDVMSIGRLGTDMIGLLFGAAGASDAQARLTGIIDAVDAPIRIDGETVDIQLSAGYAAHAAYDRVGTIDRVAIALQQARERRTQMFEFDAEAYGDPSGTLSLMSDMIGALETGSIYMTYQPKVDLRSQAISSAEALLRWEDPKRGFVSPEDFVRTAEETGHIRPLSEWVLKEVMAERGRFRAAGHNLKMAVNLSGRLLTDTDFLDWAIEILGEDAPNYCFEVTETAVIDDPDLALSNIQKLRAAGIEISIDDYGSGLSSLSYLKQIPAHELKIDKSFVLPLLAGSADALLIKSTIDLAHSLGMKVTAEGVETAEILAMLSGMGADSAQGYFISRPVKADKAIEFLNEFHQQEETPHSKIRKLRM